MRIVSFGAMITLFRISVQCTRFFFTGQRVQLDNCPSQCGRNCARVPQKWRCRLFQVWQKESKSIFLNLKNRKRVISVNSGVTWVLGISLLATTGPVRNSSLSKGKAEEISLQKIVPNTPNRTQINFPFF